MAALLGGPLVAFLGFREVAASDLAPGRDIVISEVNYNPPSDPGEDALLKFVEFRLGNGGDIVRLFDSNGQLVDQVDYDDDAPWDGLADGDGASLERISVAEDITDFTNFTASVVALPTGSPGMANSRADEIPARHGVVINESLYHPVKDPDETRLRHCQSEEFVEVHNRGPAPMDISG